MPIDLIKHRLQEENLSHLGNNPYPPGECLISQIKMPTDPSKQRLQNEVIVPILKNNKKITCCHFCRLMLVQTCLY